jgi:membrane protease YdiL (CAAX protease family)
VIRTNWRWGKVVTFIVLTFAISSVFYVIMHATGTARDVGALWMWSPALAAILTQWLFRGSILNLGWGLGNKKYLLLGLLVPVLYAGIIYGIAWSTGLAGFRKPAPAYILFLPIGLAAACLAALGEEIGWRGLLVPELSKLTTFTKTVLLTWVVWAAWHYPTIIFSDYHSQAPRWFDLSTLTISVLGLSCFTAWLRLKSNSIWPVVIWHGAHNLLIQEAFIHMTSDTPLSKFFIDDFGIGLVIATLILGYIFWKKQLELPQSFQSHSEGGVTPGPGNDALRPGQAADSRAGGLHARIESPKEERKTVGGTSLRHD